MHLLLFLGNPQRKIVALDTILKRGVPDSDPEVFASRILPSASKKNNILNFYSFVTF
jgi:hypothetical protein